MDAIITIGTSPDDWALYRGIACEHAADGFVRYTVGLHPCSVDATWAEALAQVEAFGAASSRDRLRSGNRAGSVSSAEGLRGGGENLCVAARGVCRGLAQAKRLGCAVVIHSRGAFAECVEMIDASGVDWTRVVFHCFTEGAAEMAELTRRGGFGSFTGILTYKSAENVRAAAKAQGLSRFMLETDAPYLTPMPHRGKPNEVAYVRHTAEYAASEVFGVSYEEIARVSSENARKFFGI